MIASGGVGDAIESTPTRNGATTDITGGENGPWTGNSSHLATEGAEGRVVT